MKATTINKNKVLNLIFIAIASVSSLLAQGGAATPQNENTNNGTDKNLKSLARVNPSTLAMELSLPFMSYPGRNGNSFSVGLNYSSKLWRMKNRITYFYFTPIGHYQQFVTQVEPMFAERSAAGWTTSFAFPTIEEKLELFDQEGHPFDPLLDINAFDYYFQSVSQEPNPQGNSSLINRPDLACGWVCTAQTQTCVDGVCGPWECDHWEYNVGSCPDQGCEFSGYCPASCSFCTEQPQCPSWDPNCDVDPQVPNEPTPARQMFYVKRVNVRFGDGSTHEFRKSDAIYGHCVGGPNDAPQCESLDPDRYGTFLSTDGSGQRLERTMEGSTLYLPDGSRYLFPAESIGTFDRTSLYQATELIDVHGNRTRYQSTSEQNLMAMDSQPVRKMTDTLGREIADPLPVNLMDQEQQEGTQSIDLPGFGTNGTQHYELKWLHLKPVPCDQQTTTNCGATEGALEDQSENLFFYTALICNGSPETPVDPNHQYPDQVLFPANSLGLRSCSPPTRDGNVQRFNPVVLSEVQLPNNTKYEFKYNQYGEITRILYPTGTVETFNYGRIPTVNGVIRDAYDQTNRGVIDRDVYKAGSSTPEQHWHYSAERTASFPSSTYTVTTIAPTQNNPTGNGVKTERYLYAGTREDHEYGFDDPRVGLPYEERTYDKNGVLRSRSLTEFVTTGPVPTNDPNWPASEFAQRDPRPLRTISTTIENGQALATLSENTYQDPSTDTNAPTDPAYFARLNIKRSKSHHFRNIPLSIAQSGTFAQIASYFNSSTVATLNETDYQYDANYKTRGINSLPIENRVLDADGNLLSKTQTVYDESTYLVGDSGSLIGSLANTWIDPAIDQSIPANSRSLFATPTTSKLWVSDNDPWVQKHRQFDQYGNVRKAWEVNESAGSNRFVETVYSSDYGFAYPTQLITPPPDPNSGHGSTESSTLTTAYDFKTGLPTSVTDEFGQVTTTEYNDSLLRPTKINPVVVNGVATGPVTETIYDDTNLSIKVRKQIDGSNWDEATTFMDSFGRTIKTQAKDSQGDVFVQTTYDFLGQVQMVSNPYRQGEAILWNLTEYDELGRAKQTREPVANQNPLTPTGNILGTITYDLSTAPGYFGTVIETADASGRHSRSITNALGQLIVVEEPDSSGNLNPLPQSTPAPSPTPTPTGGGDPPGGGCLLSQNCSGNFSGGTFPSYATFYKYNALGKMVQVTQGVQNRYFKYDSLGRLLRVNQPEQNSNLRLDLPDSVNTQGHWTAGFVYDVLGNVVRATDANGVNIINEYDKASRVIRRCYSKPNINTTATTCAQLGSDASTDTPTVDFFYDGKGLDSEQDPNYAKGKLTSVDNGISRTRYTSFDNFGRLLSSEQKTPLEGQSMTDATAYVSQYAYNLSGALVQETYPSGRVVKNEFESDGDLANVTSKKAGGAVYTPYVSDFSYTASGGISQMRLGNGKWETAGFNERLQVTDLGLGASATDAGLWKVHYEYGELAQDGSTVEGSKNTGNIARQTLTVPGTSFVQSYRYDSLYRLTEAVEKTGTTQNWMQNWSYDRYGNRNSFTQNIAGNNTATNPTVDQNTNRFNDNQGFVYDHNGNIIDDVDPLTLLTRTFVFNGDNKQTEVKNASGDSIGRYFYDGEGKRVKKIVGDETTVFVYSSGKLIAEYSTQTEPNPAINYTTTDHLGSPRIITDQFGQVTSRRDFLPFGEQIEASVGNRSNLGIQYSGSVDGVRQKFTGYQKDDETSLDFAEARMYENRFARFTAVDSLLSSGKSPNPQTFNRYVYAGNSPLSTTDPSGLDWWKENDPNHPSTFRPVWYAGHDSPYSGAVPWEQMFYTTYDGDFIQLFEGGPIDVPDVGYMAGWSKNGVIQGTGVYGVSAAAQEFAQDYIVAQLKAAPNVCIDLANLYLMSRSAVPMLAPQVPRIEYTNNAQAIVGHGTEFVLGFLGGGESEIASAGNSAVRSGLTNEELIQKAATLAEKRIGGTGPVAGTLKHTRAEKLINRYQSVFGSRGLETESSFLAGQEARYGTKGSIRFDVLDKTSMKAYDFKFTCKSPALRPNRIDQMLSNGPRGLKDIIEINP